MKSSVSGRGLFKRENRASLDRADDAKVERLAGATARAGSFTCPTLTVFKKAFGLGQSEEEISSRPDWGIMPPPRSGWAERRRSPG